MTESSPLISPKKQINWDGFKQYIALHCHCDRNLPDMKHYASLFEVLEVCDLHKPLKIRWCLQPLSQRTCDTLLEAQPSNPLVLDSYWSWNTTSWLGTPGNNQQTGQKTQNTSSRILHAVLLHGGLWPQKVIVSSWGHSIKGIQSVRCEENFIIAISCFVSVYTSHCSKTFVTQDIMISS